MAVAIMAAGAAPVAAAALPPYEFRKSPDAPFSNATRREINAIYSRAYSACINNPRARATNFLDCEQPETDVQDKRLNAVWRVTLARLAAVPGGAARITELHKAERLWIKQIEPFCSLTMSEGSSMTAQADYFQCEVDETIRRTIWLEHLR